MFTVGTTNATNRQDWIQKTLLKIPEGKVILDAGAGECVHKPFCKHLQYISQDFGQYDGKGEEGIQMGAWDNSKLDIVSDITKIPLGDGSVDAVMCTDVFEHIPDPIQAIKEFNRLIKPGGYLLVTAPFCSITHYAPYHFYTGFTKYFYEKFLPDNNFEVIELENNGNFFEYLGQEVHRISWVAERYANVKISFLERMMIKPTLWILQRLSKKDTSSAELLNYGYLVFARKKPMAS
jgi:SAM-dependent methyltransferase